MKSSIGSEKNAAFTTDMKLAGSTPTSNVVDSTTFVVNLRRKVREIMTFLSHCDDSVVSQRFSEENELLGLEIRI